jgi:hypothetical protein
MSSDYRDIEPVAESSEAVVPDPSSASLSDTGIQAMQGETTEPTALQAESTDDVSIPQEEQPDVPAPSKPEPEPVRPPEPPPEYTPRPAIGESGLAERAETGPGKPEKEVFFGRGLERLG